MLFAGVVKGFGLCFFGVFTRRMVRFSRILCYTVSKNVNRVVGFMFNQLTESDIKKICDAIGIDCEITLKLRDGTSI